MMREILRKACHAAGYPPLDATALRAACAYWLGSIGLSDHQVAQALGLARVRSLDTLLRGHRALDAQRQVSEMRLG